MEEIPPHVQVLTNIRKADMEGKPTFSQVQDRVQSHIPENAIIVGQNIGFDIGMLKGEGIDLTAYPWIDTSILASLVFPELASYSLGYLSRVLKLGHEPRHRAMGDVQATLELFSACWERLLELPDDLLSISKEISARGPDGYHMLFDALPEKSEKKSPMWLSGTKRQQSARKTKACQTVALAAPPLGTVHLLEESLSPLALPSILATLTDPEKAGEESGLWGAITRTWIAVKNLEACSDRLRDLLLLPEEVMTMCPPFLLPDPDAVKRFASQELFSVDEVTLALKLAWYEPDHRGDFPIHGNGEESVWNAKIACTEESPRYKDQFATLPRIVLVDHRQLLSILGDPDLPGAAALDAKSHVIIDDASMLEDTATKAYGWYIPLDDLRAGAQGHDLLTKFTDILSLWVEKTRQFQAIRHLAPSDLQSTDANGLRQQLDFLRQEHGWPSQTQRTLTQLEKFLDAQNLSGRIAWIEQRQNGSINLHSVPERIGQLLSDCLYKRSPTTLLIPQGADTIPEILGPGVDSERFTSAFELLPIPITHEPDCPLEQIVTNPPDGKTILLLPSRRTIEDMFVKHQDALEARGITMICQGLSGGQNRMQSEFLVAEAPAIWLLTPWTFEGVELPEKSVDHLVIQSLPFDHPSQVVLSRRSNFYRDGFSEYCMPRLLHRLFRLLRTFTRMKTKDADVTILDPRIETKEYGKRVWGYLQQFSTNGSPVKKSAEPREKKAATKKDDPPSLF